MALDAPGVLPIQLIKASQHHHHTYLFRFQVADSGVVSHLELLLRRWLVEDFTMTLRAVGIAHTGVEELINHQLLVVRVLFVVRIDDKGVLLDHIPISVSQETVHLQHRNRPVKRKTPA